MVVTIWRHGEAGSAASDRQRELTGRGMDDIGFGCTQFHEACDARGIPAPDRLAYSPWLRTTQTADIIASAFSHATVSPMAALQPGSTVSEVDAALSDLFRASSPPQHLVLVSHQPLVSHLVDYYLGARGRAPALPPGGVVTLAFEVPAADCGRLLFWALPPEYEAGV